MSKSKKELTSEDLVFDVDDDGFSMGDNKKEPSAKSPSPVIAPKSKEPVVDEGLGSDQDGHRELSFDDEDEDVVFISADGDSEEWTENSNFEIRLEQDPSDVWRDHVNKITNPEYKNTLIQIFEKIKFEIKGYAGFEKSDDVYYHVYELVLIAVRNNGNNIPALHRDLCKVVEELSADKDHQKYPRKLTKEIAALLMSSLPAVTTGLLPTEIVLPSFLHLYINNQAEAEYYRELEATVFNVIAEEIELSRDALDFPRYNALISLYYALLDTLNENAPSGVDVVHLALSKKLSELEHDKKTQKHASEIFKTVAKSLMATMHSEMVFPVVKTQDLKSKDARYWNALQEKLFVPLQKIVAQYRQSNDLATYTTVLTAYNGLVDSFNEGILSGVKAAHWKICAKIQRWEDDEQFANWCDTEALIKKAEAVVINELHARIRESLPSWLNSKRNQLQQLQDTPYKQEIAGIFEKILANIKGTQGFEDADMQMVRFYNGLWDTLTKHNGLATKLNPALCAKVAEFSLNQNLSESMRTLVNSVANSLMDAAPAVSSGLLARETVLQEFKNPLKESDGYRYDQMRLNIFDKIAEQVEFAREARD
nr:hypothetical protein [Pseudomonadota bacterium]